MDIHYIIGDALSPIKTPALICHVCNDIGRMGSGFVVPLCKINPDIKTAYERWYHEKSNSHVPFGLGAVQILNFKDNIWVANMIAQHDVRPINGIPPIRYEALSKCLYSCYEYAKSNKLTIHMPRIGSVRSGGSWTEISKTIQSVADLNNVETYVYTLPNETGQWPNTPYENNDINDLNDVFN